MGGHKLVIKLVKSWSQGRINEWEMKKVSVNAKDDSLASMCVGVCLNGVFVCINIVFFSVFMIVFSDFFTCPFDSAAPSSFGTLTFATKPSLYSHTHICYFCLYKDFHLIHWKSLEHFLLTSQLLDSVTQHKVFFLSILFHVVSF